MSTYAERAHFTKIGGPEVIHWIEEKVPEPGEGEVTVRHDSVGVNYTDIYHRTGEYPVSLPSALGVEGAGIIEAVGPGVSEYAKGDRVVYGGRPLGSYSTVRTMSTGRMVKLPDEIDFRTASATLFKGLAVEYLIRRCYQVKRGDVVLFHALAGGVGLIACQWLKHLGATVIGTVSSEKKAQLVTDYGCDHAIIYTRESFVDRVKDITGGKGVDVVYDAIGKDTVEDSLKCLRPRGMLVNFGNTSGAPPMLDFKILQKNSLYVTRPSIAHYAGQREEMVPASQAVFEMIGKGLIKADEITLYPLRQAAEAQRDLEGRRTAGSILLVP